jgi:predicted CoA-binding protein
MPVTDDDELREILGAETIAVVGCSTSPGKAAHDIPKYMLDQGYDVIPVNPFADEVFDRTAYDSLADVPEDIDLVDVFRPGEEAPEIAEDAVDREEVETVWLQLGITNDEAGERVEAAGKRFVQDRCLKVEHQRLRG